MNREDIATRFKLLQEEICMKIEVQDSTGRFQSDTWVRAGGGGGDTRILQNGTVLEKAGVNFSSVYGQVSDKMKVSFGFEEPEFYATGVSIVMHPVNPFVPVIHMNVRYFESGDMWWFGGGIDLTPIYINEEDAVFFHTTLKNVCDLHDQDYYPKFKKWADDYFFIPHRNETRGIGGIFFDRLNAERSGKNKEDIFSFVISVGNAFAPLYSHLIENNKNKACNSQNRKWQSIRRSRYVEFNLLYDKGTKFGLDSDGRVESILMSMPPVAEWYYNFVPDEGSEERKTQDLLIKNKAWI